MKVLRQFLFEGKINRIQFWKRIIFFHLLGGLIFGAPIFVEALTTTLDGTYDDGPQDPSVYERLIYSTGFFLVLAGYFAAIPRRLHDLGQSGWWTLGFFIPYVGAPILLVYCGFFPSKKDEEIIEEGQK